MIPDGDSQIMIDNHDNQRGHGQFEALRLFHRRYSSDI